MFCLDRINYFNIIVCTITNKCTTISQTTKLPHASTPQCHSQGACNQHPAPCTQHRVITQLQLINIINYFIPGQNDSSIKLQTVYTATTQTDFMRIAATKLF